MKSKTTGTNTSPEVTHVSSHGIWLYWGEREYFLDYGQFPWFRDARIAEIIQVEAVTDSVLHWPALDVDLSLDIIEHPDRYPNVSKG